MPIPLALTLQASQHMQKHSEWVIYRLSVCKTEKYTNDSELLSANSLTEHWKKFTYWDISTRPMKDLNIHILATFIFLKSVITRTRTTFVALGANSGSKNCVLSKLTI